MLNELSQLTIFGIQVINPHEFGHLILKLLIDLFFVMIIIRMIFYPVYRERSYVFTTILLNLTIFLICFLLSNLNLKIGFAFGLFAVFSIIRYRTEQIPIRNMTYLFTVIIVAVLNALSDYSISYAELIVANMVIVMAVFILEKNLFIARENTRIITYEKIELIKPQSYNDLIVDLKERTGLNIIKADIVTINFLNDTAQLKILYQCTDPCSESTGDD